MKTEKQGSAKAPEAGRQGGGFAQKKTASQFQQQHAVSAKLLKRKHLEKPEFRGIVRIAGKDVEGHYTVREALRKVKGVGANLAASISKIVLNLGFVANELVGNLSEEEESKLEEVVKYPHKFGVKWFMLNRPKDVESGESKHLVMSDLGFALKQDLTREREARSYRGWRHSIGQKVRGQHTRTTGRSGMTVGVSKKAVKAQKAAAASSAQEKSAAGKEKK